MEDWHNIRTSSYFKSDVLRRRPYLKPEWCRDISLRAIHQSKQPDGRTRYWIFIEENGKYLRLVILEDGETLHNAFFDRRFKGVPKE